MIVRVTGAGRTDPPLATGSPAPSGSAIQVRARPYVQSVQGPVSARCDFESLTLVPGMVGVAEAKIRIPKWVSSDDIEWTLTFDFDDSAGVRVYVDARAPD